MAQVRLLPVAHGFADGVAFARNPPGVLERCQKFGAGIGPAALEVDVLCVDYQERSIEVRETERYDEFRTADAPVHCVGCLNFIPDAYAQNS